MLGGKWIAQVAKYLNKNCYDPKFSANKKKYILQSLAATLIVYFVLTTLSVISNFIVIASIASTSFGIFVYPHSKRSRVRFILGGYFIGLSVGVVCYYLMVFSSHYFPMLHFHFDEIFAAFAVGVSLFLMVVFDFEHPPASSAALALVINDWNLWTLIITMIALLILITSRALLRKHLIQLI